MENKEIYIDGVDVSGCLHYSDRNGYCEACKDDIDGHSYTKCSVEDNCHYKQLKHKEQLLEKAKLMLQTIIETNKVYPLQNNLSKLLDIIEGKENE